MLLADWLACSTLTADWLACRILGFDLSEVCVVNAQAVAGVEGEGERLMLGQCGLGNGRAARCMITHWVMGLY